MKPGKGKQKQRVKRGKSWLPEDVLAGKVVLSARELVELIQRVNPTDRELPRAEVARRYRYKNQLQSLLVRRFASEVEVSADREGVALLAHRGSGRSACHAVLAELDEDARSWVQRRLDEAATPEPATATAAPPARASARSSRLMNGNAAGHLAESELLLDGDVSAEELLARGHEAMAAYDYELARHAYERALASSGGDAAAAGALLGLLVEHLAAYAEAAALWPRLSPGAAADVRVRTLVALAAAQVDEEARARELLRSLTRAGHLTAAAVVYQVLARRSLERDDEAGDAAAAHDLALARQHGGASLALLELERELVAQVARRYAPLEAHALEAYEAGHVDDAEQQAHDVLARWPDSHAARSLLGHIEAQRKQSRVDALLARADSAMAARDFALAAGLLREARALDVTSEERRASIAARLEQVAAAAREQAAHAQVSEVVALFAQERLEEGLFAYLGLDGAQRAEVRHTHSTAMLAWLEDMGAPPAGARAKAAVQAVLALARACAALAQDDGHMAEAEIAAHEKMLQKVPAWRAVQKEAAEAITRSERARAQEGIARAAALLDTGGDSAQARALADAIDPCRLAEPARAALEALRARLAYAESRAAIEARIERALARGDLLDARDVADAGLAMAIALPDERAAWQRRRDDLNARLRRAWCIQVCPGDGRPILDRLGVDPYALGHGAPITPDGAHFILAVSLRCWLFLRMISTRDMRVTQYVLMRTPAPLLLDTITVLDDELTLTGKQGKILRLKRDTWDVIAWRDLTAFVGEHERISDMQLMVGTDFLWLWMGSTERAATLLIVDLARWSLHRSLSGPMRMPRRVGPHTRAMMLLEGAGVRSGIYRADGTREAQYRLPEASGFIETVTCHPHASGLIVVDRIYRAQSTSTRVRWFTEAGREFASVETDAGFSTECESFGSDPDSGLIFLVPGRGIEERAITAIATDGGLRVLYRVPLSEHVALLQDTNGIHRFALDWDVARFELVPVGSESPILTTTDPKQSPLIEQRYEFECSATIPASEPHLCAFRAGFEHMTREEIATALHALQRDPDMNARMWADVVMTLASDYSSQASDEYVAWALARYPDHADLALNAADYHANQSSLSELSSLLEAIDAGQLSPPRIRHLYHLRGLALLESGRLDEALAAWTQGAAYAHGEQGACELQPYIEMLAPVDLDRDEGGLTTVAGRVHWSAMAADCCLARGDVRSALAAVERAHVWQTADMQSVAPLARAYLRSEDPSPMHVFHQLLALAAFDACSKPDPEFYLANRLAFPGATFSDEELVALAERVRVWLEEHAQRVSSGAADSPD
jgi:hypothetical protein